MLQRLKSLASEWTEQYKDAGTCAREAVSSMVEQIDRIIKRAEEMHLYKTSHKVVGIDMGKTNCFSAVTHDTSKQSIHVSGEKTKGTEERFKSYTLFGGQWRFDSGQQQYTRLMKTRTHRFVPDIGTRPTTKTTDVGALMESYRFMNQRLWSVPGFPEARGLDKAFFSTLWFRKQRMQQYSRRQRALEKAVAEALGTSKRKEQKNVIVAYGDGCPTHNMKGVAPVPNLPFYRKLKERAICVLVDEYNTSKCCSCCFSDMPNRKGKNQWRIKRCGAVDCKRKRWNRDVNAAINMFNLLLWQVAHGSYEGRPTPFQRKQQE